MSESLPPTGTGRSTKQSWYYNTPYPPPVFQQPSPTSSQSSSTSQFSPSPTEQSYPTTLQLPQILPFPVPASQPCATVHPYPSPSRELPHFQQHLPQQISHFPPLTFPLSQTVVPADSVPPHIPQKLSRTFKCPSKRSHTSHPYARLFAKKDDVKRRKIWNHTLEKYIFTPHEIASIGAPQRRAIYIATLEAHINRVHHRLLSAGIWPVNQEEVDSFKGLNCKTAKSMVAGLQHDASIFRLKLLELERANGDLHKVLSNIPPES